ncbi:carbohydrate binding family 9 domain-containing protein [Hymenobacter sp. B81]|uniref:carbohydrate binding family 9 domain-containing protein n=1 Tax=Hymenobacter sp. B81 TaxID=3344878 RepID=UPI0037DBF6DA
MFLRVLLLLLISLPSLPALAQSGTQGPVPAQAAVNINRRQLEATRLSTEAVKLDGNLDEPAWREAQIATGFIQNSPNPGPRETHPTEVRILYDAALYVGAIMHDVSLDSIPRELTQRDNFGNSDFFGILLDTYHDKLNGYGFFVTPAGVQLDARYSPAGGEDWAWNAVWESRTALQGTDWVAEMRIPYSAIRFSSQAEQVWGLQLMRNRRSTR